MRQLPEMRIAPGVWVQTEAALDRLRLTNANGAVIYLTNHDWQMLVRYCVDAEINGVHNGY